MKHHYLILLLVTSLSFAQIPSNYYDSANGLSGYDLKMELKSIITNGHFWNDITGYDDLYTAYVSTHSDVSVSSGNVYENDGSVLDFYSENPASSMTNNDPYNYTHGSMQCGNQMAEGDCYNREHLIPQSSFGSAYPMQADIHHVIPTDGRVNNFRGNLPFGEVATPDFTSMNGSLRGSSDIVGYSGTMFEPIDEFKGDIARALLYFATRYEDTVDGYTSFEMFNGTSNQVFPTWAVTMLLDWHNNVDPVDQREIERNEAAYAFQGNANPFVDHPEYANLIWNPAAGDTEAPSTPTNLNATNPSSTTVDLTWTASTDNVGVVAYDVYIGGVFYVSTPTASTTYTVMGLTPETSYDFTVLAKDAANNMSAQSAATSETTLADSGGSPELFISEYVEGGGTNKALEIANFTGATVDLSNYTLKLSSNGNAAWTYTYSFPGSAQIASTDVYVVANSGLNAACQSEQDDVNNSIIAFSGNDAVGLFKNDVLIDILGTLGDGSSYAQNTTLVRKPEIAGPNTTFTISEWNTLAQDTCSGLGMHSQTLGVVDLGIEEVSFYPNPVKGQMIHFNNRESLTVTVYNVIGKRIMRAQLDGSFHGLNISSLKKGIYILKIKSDTGTTTKKLIRQ